MRIRVMEIGVGAFLLAGMVALLMLALNVSGLNLESKNTYKVYARFENIGGADRALQSDYVGCADWSGE